MRYYYKDNNNNLYNFKSEHNEENLIPITEEEFNKASAPKELSEAEKLIIAKYNEINTLKNKLKETDYKAIKYAEGLITKTAYASIKEERQGYRDQINTLETELEKLKQEADK